MSEHRASSRGIGVREPLRGVVYASAERLERYVRAGALRHETLIGALVQSFERNSSRIAIAGPETRLTYQELDELSDRAAAGFLALGLRALDRVVFQLPNGSDLLICVIACWKAGLVPLCTLASHRAVEIGYLARHAGARAHVVAGNDPKFDFVDFAARVRIEVPSLEFVVAAGDMQPRAGVFRLNDLLSQCDPGGSRRRIRDLVRTYDPFQVTAFQLSGGTTGVPKIIPRFSNEYLYQIRSIGEYTALAADDVMMCPAPMLHNAPLICCWAPALLAGAMILTDADVTVPGIAATLSRQSPTRVLLPPPAMSNFSTALQQVERARPYIRLLISVWGIAQLRRDLRVPVVPLFGMTEGLVMLGKPDDPAESLESTVGRPVSQLDEIRLLDPQSQQSVEPGEKGELTFSGPCALPGYFDAEERNREAFTSDGFYRSGDLVSMREIGGRSFYAFEGRVKDVIDRGGEKINCEEVERFIRRYPGVRDAALVAMPDPKYGERGCAFVVMDVSLTAPSVADLGRHLHEQGLAKFKWPERIEQLEALPFNRTGKTDKSALRGLAAQPARRAGVQFHGG